MFNILLKDLGEKVVYLKAALFSPEVSFFEMKRHTYRVKQPSRNTGESKAFCDAMVKKKKHRKNNLSWLCIRPKNLWNISAVCSQQQSWLLVLLWRWASLWINITLFAGTKSIFISIYL